MADHRSPQTLLEELEAIRNSLDNGPEAQSIIPTLEDVVGQRAPTSVNLNNPFLSSNSLSALLKIRNDAESVAAQERSELTPLGARDKISDSELELALEPSLVAEVMPDPGLMIGQMEQLLASWIEDSVAEHMVRFERELRVRLEQDFHQLIARWYQEQGLALPAHVRTFLSPEQPNEADNNASTDDTGSVP